jgi:hypothetical protein
MTESRVKRRLRFRRSWINVMVGVVAVVIIIYVGGIVVQLLFKPVMGQKYVTTSEVESSVRDAAKARDADVSRMSCHESPTNKWRCVITLADGQVVKGSAIWRESAHSLGINLELR